MMQVSADAVAHTGVVCVAGTGRRVDVRGVRNERRSDEAAVMMTPRRTTEWRIAEVVERRWVMGGMAVAILGLSPLRSAAEDGPPGVLSDGKYLVVNCAGGAAGAGVFCGQERPILPAAHGGRGSIAAGSIWLLFPAIPAGSMHAYTHTHTHTHTHSGKDEESGRTQPRTPAKRDGGTAKQRPLQEAQRQDTRSCCHPETQKRHCG